MGWCWWWRGLVIWKMVGFRNSKMSTSVKFNANIANWNGRQMATNRNKRLSYPALDTLILQKAWPDFPPQLFISSSRVCTPSANATLGVFGLVRILKLRKFDQSGLRNFPYDYYKWLTQYKRCASLACLLRHSPRMTQPKRRWLHILWLRVFRLVYLYYELVP